MPDRNPTPTRRVLVTGGSGYIGRWCVLAALVAGHDVRTTVRDLGKAELLRSQLHAEAAFDDARLEIVLADLAAEAGWEAAVAGTDAVLHVASPTLRNAIDEDTMIADARDGVLRVLRAARDGGARRVVLTSASGAVVYGHARESMEHPFTEEDWTNLDADLAPYQRSKTLAELAAWRFVEEEGAGLELVAVNPTTVIGPALGDAEAPSLRVIRGLLSGELPICPPFGTGWVDVRDVADLHLRAMTDPAAAGERFLAISGRSLRIVEVARILRARLGERARRVPTRELSVPFARALGVVNPQLRALRPQLGKNFPSTSAKAERLLGWRPRSVEESLVDTAESLFAAGAIATRAA